MTRKNCEECVGRLIRCAGCMDTIARLEAKLGQHNFIGHGAAPVVAQEEIADIKYYHGPLEQVG